MGKKISNIKHEHNTDFDRLLIDAKRGALGEKFSSFMTRPAYAHTSMEQKTIFPRNKCRQCGYYQENELGKEECTFPWFDPQDYDIAVYDNLPCGMEVRGEKD